MVRVTVILLQVIIAASTGFVKSDKDAGKGFVYIGSYPPKPSTNFDINRYFISANPTIWATAEEDCRNMLGTHGRLLAIDTLAEWEFLKVALEQYGFGTTYWTSGMHDPTTNVWRWTTNHQPVPPYPPWGPNFPSNPILTIHRILIFHTSRYNANWQTVGDSQLHRYICKIPTSQC